MNAYEYSEIYDLGAPAYQTDWQDFLFGTAPTTSHDISVKGNGKRNSFFFSGSYFSQNGIVAADIAPEKSRYERFTFNGKKQNKTS